MLKAVQYSEMSGGGVNPDAIADMIIKLQEHIDTLVNANRKYLDELLECERICTSGSAGLHILWLNKVKRVSLEDAAGRFGYSRRQAYRLFDHVYFELFDLLPDERKVIPAAI